MAFKAEPMQRTIVVSSKSQQKAIIETLHELHIAHFVDYTEEREGEFGEFRIGRPLAEAGPASETLVRLRALIRQLDLEGHKPERAFTVAEIEERLAGAVTEIDTEITTAAESRADMTASLERLADEEANLRPLATLPLNLEDYRGYESLEAFVGYTAEPFEDALAAQVPDYSLFTGENDFFALFVPRDNVPAATEVLTKAGYREHPVPEGSGSPAQRIEAIGRERRETEEKLQRAESTLETLRGRHGDFLVAAEEHLTISVAKAEAPLSFATTENAFIIDAWIPEPDVPRVETALVRATNGNVHLQPVAGNGHPLHGADAAFGGEAFHVNESDDEHAHEDDVKNEPPVLLRNPGPARHFQFFTEMFAMPRYKEVDPTTAFAFAFPLFFGFMIGDFGLGLLMMLLGGLMFKKLGHIEGVKQLGFAIAVAGVVSAIFGGIVFTDAFGIPFGFNHHMEEELHHLHIAEGCTTEVYQALGETTWSCLLAGEVWHIEPIILKSFDVQTMLLLSIGAAIVHLFVGLLFGIRNEWGHSTKHTAAKFGWMILLLTFGPAAFALLGPETWTAFTGLAPSAAFTAAGAGILVGGVVLGWAEGIQGVVEIPSMFSNILSYLRLGAVAIAKGSMAIAFNKMTLIDIGLVNGGAMLIVGFIVFILAQALLFVLGLVSSGVQALRLNYVEFFTKFYKGGGEPFKPFGHVRRYSTETAPATGGGKL